ncbi:MAG: hypothetical protein QMB09_04990 [Flavobacteriales bacterium]
MIFIQSSRKVELACKTVFFTLSILFFQDTSLAQNEVDVLRYSITQPTGSIRTTAMGGAFGALGADIASMGINPAGIGMYRRGDVSISTGLFSSKTKATLGETSNLSSDISATIGSFGIALTIPSVNPDWPFITLGIAHQKQAIFDQRLVLENAQLNSSLLGGFQSLAEGTPNADLDDGSAFPYTASLAWYAYLIDPDGSSDTEYITPFNTSESIAVNRRIERSGNMGETQYSMGSTYMEWLSLGATLGVTKLKFIEESRHEEMPLEEGTELASWTYTENLDVEGTGFNIKIGAIAKVSDWMRLGLSLHSPTRLHLIDSYNTSISSIWKNGESYSETSPEGGYEYLIITPGRAIFSASILMGKLALLSADYETVNYKGGKLKSTDGWLSSDYEFEAENDAVTDSYSRGHEARLGLEVRVAKNWRVRMGSGFSTSPYSVQSGVISDPSKYKASFGGEFRSEQWYAGFSWTRTWYSEDLYLMDPAVQLSPIDIERTLGMISIGAGYRL